VFLLVCEFNGFVQFSHVVCLKTNNMFPTFFIVLLSSVLICMLSVCITNIIKQNSCFMYMLSHICYGYYWYILLAGDSLLFVDLD